MFKHVLTTLVIAATFGLTTAWAGEMKLLEEAAEFDRLSVRVSADGYGYVQVKRCDECEAVRLRIAPGAALELNGKRRPLQEVNNGALTSGTVFYNAETLSVLLISGSR